MFYLYVPCRLSAPIRPGGRGNKYHAMIVSSPTPSTSALLGMRLRSHMGFSCANKHSPITLVISFTLLRFVTSDGGKGETKQEKHSGRTMAIHEHRASGNEMTERCRESYISLVLPDRGFPRDCCQGNISLARSESVRRNREPPERIAAGKK